MVLHTVSAEPHGNIFRWRSSNRPKQQQKKLERMAQRTQSPLAPRQASHRPLWRRFAPGCRPQGTGPSSLLHPRVWKQAASSFLQLPLPAPSMSASVLQDPSLFRDWGEGIFRNTWQAKSLTESRVSRVMQLVRDGS